MRLWKHSLVILAKIIQEWLKEIQKDDYVGIFKKSMNVMTQYLEDN